jgi:hypothetical protein
VRDEFEKNTIKKEITIKKMKTKIEKYFEIK